MAVDLYWRKLVEIGVIITEDSAKEYLEAGSELVVVSHADAVVAGGSAIRGKWSIECSIKQEGGHVVWVPIAMVAMAKPKYYKSAYGFVSFLDRIGLEIVNVPLRSGVTTPPMSLKKPA